MIQTLLVLLLIAVVGGTWLVLDAIYKATRHLSSRLKYIANVLEGEPTSDTEDIRYQLVRLKGESYKDFVERSRDDPYGVDYAPQWLAKNDAEPDDAAPAKE
jgi:hypothetical protein